MTHSQSSPAAGRHCLAWAALIGLVVFNCCTASASDMRSVFDLFQKLCDPRLTSYQDILDRARTNGWERIENPDHPPLKKLLSVHPEFVELYPGTREQQQLFRTKFHSKEVFVLVGSLWDPPYAKESSVSITLFDFARVHDDVRQRLEEWLGQPPRLTMQPYGDSFEDEWHELDARIGEAASVGLTRRPLESRVTKEVGFGGTIIQASALVGQ